MTAPNDGGPAFPVPTEQMINRGRGPEHPGPFGWGRHEGMTLRDYFAAHALAGLLGNQDFGRDPEEHLAAGAYRQADAMLAAREVK